MLFTKFGTCNRTDRWFLLGLLQERDVPPRRVLLLNVGATPILISLHHRYAVFPSGSIWHPHSPATPEHNAAKILHLLSSRVWTANYHARIRFPDGPTPWLMRVPRVASCAVGLPESLAEYLILSEHATPRFLETTAVLAPRAFGYGVRGNGTDKGDHLLVDENLNITGIIDWQMALVVPRREAFGASLVTASMSALCRGEVSLSVGDLALAEALKEMGSLEALHMADEKARRFCWGLALEPKWSYALPCEPATGQCDPEGLWGRTGVGRAEDGGVGRLRPSTRPMGG